MHMFKKLFGVGGKKDAERRPVGKEGDGLSQDYTPDVERGYAILSKNDGKNGPNNPQDDADYMAALEDMNSTAQREVQEYINNVIEPEAKESVQHDIPYSGYDENGEFVRGMADIQLEQTSDTNYQLSFRSERNGVLSIMVDDGSGYTYSVVGTYDHNIQIGNEMLGALKGVFLTEVDNMLELKTCYYGE